MRAPFHAALPLVVAVTTLLGHPLHADASAPQLVVSGDLRGCPSGHQLRRAIVAHLGRDDFDEPDAPRVEVRIYRTSSPTVVAEVEVTAARAPSTATAVRRLEAGDGDCTALVRAAALSIALTLGKDDLPAASAPPPVRQLAPSSPPRADASREVRQDRFSATISGMTAVGLLPTPGPGGGLAARVRVSTSVWLSARGMFLPHALMPNREFGVSLAAGGVGACAEPFAWASVAALGCAHALAGTMTVEPGAAGLGSSTARPFGAVGFSAGVRARVVAPLSLEAAVESIVPVAHPTLLTEGCPAVGFRQPLAALALTVGVGVTIR